MENELIADEDKVYIKEINGIRGIHYKINYNNQNFLKDERFKKWLNEEKIKKGKSAPLYKCKNCDIFLYGEYDEVKSFPHCDKFIFDELICSFCGKLYHGYSYCCPKRGLTDDFLFFFFNTFYIDFLDCGKYIPLFFNIIFIGNIFYSLFLHRKYKIENNEFGCYDDKWTKPSIFTRIIALLFALILSFVYFFGFIIIYFIFLILYFIV